MNWTDALKWINEKLSNFATWLSHWCKENIDFALILAVCTETPRWTVTFVAIHEPLWIGISLGVLLAFATSKVWRFYFATKSKTTLTFNVLAIILAVAVISPVLFAMIEKKPEDVNVSEVLQKEELKWGWSVALALTTFVPLVQLAAVHGATVKKDDIVQTPIFLVQPKQNVQSTVHVQADNSVYPNQVNPEDAQRAKMLKSEGLNNTQIGRELNVHRNTVTKLLRTANGHTA